MEPSVWVLGVGVSKAFPGLSESHVLSHINSEGGEIENAKADDRGLELL